MTAASPKPKLTVGTLVRFKGRPMALMPGRRMRGGEGRVTAVLWDAVGLVYRVELNDGRIHSARPEHLQVHRDQTDRRARGRRSGASR